MIQPDCVLVRYSGEIGIKSKRTARRLLRALVSNITAHLKARNVSFSEVAVQWGRILIRGPESQEAARVASKVFGVVSTSPAMAIEADLGRIKEAAVDYSKSLVGSGKTFAIRSRRTGKHPFTSKDVAEEVGSAVLRAYKGRNVSVDLDHPDVEIFIEVRDRAAYVFHERIDGVGGFPLNTGGRFVCLLSGGLDSSVACYLAMRRGCLPVFVYLDNDPYAGGDTRDRMFDVVSKLCQYAVGWKTRVYVVPHGRALAAMIDGCERRLTCLLCHRMMLRVAETIAKREGADAIVTGECIGEQASQTLRNIRVVNEALSEIPVIRPVSGMDKEDIVRLAREIQTYDICSRSVTACTAPPRHPTTRAELNEVKKEETKIDVHSFIKNSVERAEVITVENPIENSVTYEA